MPARFCRVGTVRLSGPPAPVLKDPTMRPSPALFILVSAALLAACSRPEPAQAPVRAVKLLTVSASDVEAQWSYSGEVQAQLESSLGFRVGGKLLQRPAQVGQRVKAGQLLARLDPSDLALASQAAQAQVSAATTQRDLAAADLKRFTDLQTQGFVSGADIERRQATLKSAESSLRQAAAQSAVQGNQASYSQLLADADAVVVGVDAEVGQVLAPGAPVVRLARNGARDVLFSVPEGRLAYVSVGQVARVSPPGIGLPNATGGVSWEGRVREIAAAADPVTRTFTVKLSLPADAPVALGSTAYVTLPSAGAAAGAAAIKLPTSALIRSTQGDRSGSSVWVFDAGSSTVSERAIEVAGADGNQVLVAKGLAPGDEVVVAGVHVLSPGQKVTRFTPAPAQ